MATGYDWIKGQASMLNVAIPDLLALARANDPFFAGSPGQTIAAKWFLGLWQRFGYSTGVHLRRVHYQLVSQPDATLWDGKRYSNTERCWNALCGAGKAARYLGMIAPNAFEDHRNPDPHVNVYERYAPAQPAWTVDYPSWDLPTIQVELADNLSLDAPSTRVSGYDYMASDQPYHVEIWVEKSTMDDVIEPIAQRQGVNYVTSLGFQSITSVVSLLSRIRKAGKPARILYISDYDPAGDAMPVAVARQVEYWAQYYGINQEIKLEPVALTRQLVEEYRLPPIPIKETDLRRANFEARYGAEGAVELDALEALHPGVLARLLTATIRQYRDRDLESKLATQETEADDLAQNAWGDLTSDVRASLEAVDEEVRTVLSTYQGRLEKLAGELAEELAPLGDQLANITGVFEARQQQLAPTLPKREQPETDEPDESRWLFDSTRSYGEQLSVYRRRKLGVGGAVGEAEDE